MAQGQNEVFGANLTLHRDKKFKFGASVRIADKETEFFRRI